ncbi:hypothetical protein [Rubrivivax gelatinosus]|uniref:hypothetical protein n=1 Tax=Rubrivivax gelatinosus TaxID=28068 RepID=UPI0019040841|nr:hypothetical protein [Rubrivivax gelatinosus]
MSAIASRRLAFAALFVLVAGAAAAQTSDTDPNAIPTLPPPAPTGGGAPLAPPLQQPAPLPPRQALPASQPASSAELAGPGIAPGLREPAPGHEPPGVQDKQP